MIQQREDVRLAFKSSDAVRIAGDGIGQGLDRNVPFETRVAGAIHVAHAAGPERRQDAIRPDFGYLESTPWRRGSRSIVGSMAVREVLEIR